MKLYYAPGACSLAPHIALRETGAQFELEKVDLAKKVTESGADFTQINPKGYVPALQLEDGEILTEASVTLQYIADQSPESGIAPAAGTIERYRLMEWLNFISTEIHKTLGALFNPNISDAHRENQVTVLGRRSDFLSEALKGKQYLVGHTFSVADAYLFTVLNWRHMLNVDMSQWQVITDYLTRIGDRPSVQEAMKAEGLSS
jgi:glutathione S-transferase